MLVAYPWDLFYFRQWLSDLLRKQLGPSSS